jgi:hypothetical protein
MGGMKNLKALAKNQLTNLLLNAYGFVDKNGVIFKTDKYLLHSWEFKLESFTGSNYQIIEFSYDNATFEDGIATFETHDGDTESFKVLMVAVDYRP